jgi:hypothetical protein
VPEVTCDASLERVARRRPRVADAPSNLLVPDSSFDFGDDLVELARGVVDTLLGYRDDPNRAPISEGGPQTGRSACRPRPQRIVVRVDIGGLGRRYLNRAPLHQNLGSVARSVAAYDEL